MKKKVSVIIPTYGRPNNLLRALKSVYNQTYSNIEIIVVDDNPPNSKFRLDTEEIINNNQSSNLIYIKHKVNKNGSAARNTGILVAKGDYIAFLDDDDEFEEDKIEKQYAFLEANKQYDACYCRSFFYKNTKLVFKSSYNKIGDITKDILLLKTEYNSSTLFFTSKSLKAINGFDESFVRNQDYEIMIRFLRNHRIGVIDEFLIKRHTDDIINQPPFKEYMKIRLMFMSQFENDVKKFSKSFQRDIKRALYFDLSYYAFKQKKIITSFYYLVKSKPNTKMLLNNISKIKKVFNKLLS